MAILSSGLLRESDIGIPDTRSINTAPNALISQAFELDFKTSSVIGAIGGGYGHSTLMTLNGWITGDASGTKAFQLAFSSGAAANTPKLQIRAALNNATTWDSWQYIPILDTTGSLILGSGNIQAGDIACTSLSITGSSTTVANGDSSYTEYGPNTTWGGRLRVGSGAGGSWSASGRATIYTDNGDLALNAGIGQSLYLNLAGGNGTIYVGGTTNILMHSGNYTTWAAPYKPITDTYTFGTVRFYGSYEGLNSGQPWSPYGIYQEAGGWANPFPDLNINYHSGIKIGAYYAYGGTRFYSNDGNSNNIELFSVGNGDYNVRVLNSAIVSTSLSIGTSAVPTNPLNVSSGTNSTLATFTNTDASASGYSELIMINNLGNFTTLGSIGSGHTNADWSASGYLYTNQAHLRLKSAGDIIIGTGGLTNDKNRVIIDGVGNITHIKPSLGGFSIGETYTNYDSWETQLNVHGSINARLNVKTGNIRCGVYAHNTWNPVNGVAGGGYIGNYTDHPLSLIVNAQQKLVINTSGQVGIGTTSPTHPLTVQGATTNDVAKFVKADGTGNPLYLYVDGTTSGIFNSANAAGGGFYTNGSSLYFRTSGTNKASIDDPGHFSLVGNVYANGSVSAFSGTQNGYVTKSGSTITVLAAENGGGASTRGFVGTTSNHPFGIHTNGLQRVTVGTDGSMSVTGPITAVGTTNALWTGSGIKSYSANQTQFVKVDFSGISVNNPGTPGQSLFLAIDDVTKATLTAQGNFTIPGTLYAASKSFKIDHPTKPNKKLVHGSLEGPENGVYIRGKATSNIIELPEYWTELVDQDSITVSLTPIGKHQDLYVADIRDNVVYIENGNLINKSINCFYMINAERKDIAKLEVEIDD